MYGVSFVVANAFSVFKSPFTVLMVLAGTFMGLVFGSLPGLTATMAVALLIPMTFTLEPVTAIGVMLGAYIGGDGRRSRIGCAAEYSGNPFLCCNNF